MTSDHSIEVTDVVENDDGSATLHFEIGDGALKTLLNYAVTKVELSDELTQALLQEAMLDIIKKQLAAEQAREEENEQ